MNQGSLWGEPIHTYRDLPDPRDPNAPSGARTELVLFEDYWRKIILKHIAEDREPWREVFLADERRALIKWAEGGPLDQEESARFEKCLARLGEEIRRALARPLVLLSIRKYSGRKPIVSWSIVLPCGALVCVHSISCPPGDQESNVLKTCYIPWRAAVKPSEERWQQVARFLIWVYGEKRDRRIYPPEPSTMVVRYTPSGVSISDRNIRFVTLEQWGFSLGTPGNPWSGRLPDWEKEIAPKEQRKLRQLRKRRKSQTPCQAAGDPNSAGEPGERGAFPL
ncbi:MAG: hypothetical protein NZ899_08040 [Thermoguttaceae bacterium]|nr:hypothetical protein [Thermoguttaceae bacterium]MDW8078105.1 hypothetical protein [Thermoguttaceae bacterium]